MLTGIFDTHAHYDDPKLAQNLDEVLREQRERGVALIINNGSDLESSRASVALAEKYDMIYAAVGIHPHEVDAAPAGWLSEIEQLARSPKVVAIGEIGLDYFYDHSDRDNQKAAFRAQLALAQKLGLPVQIHDRDAHGDTLAILQEYRPKGTVHRYSGSPEMASELYKIGMHLGVGCAITYPNSKKEVATVKDMPLEWLLLETDCPYLAPAHMRGAVSTSDMISFAAEKIAEIRGDVTAQQVVDIARENGVRLFRIPE